MRCEKWPSMRCRRMSSPFARRLHLAGGVIAEHAGRAARDRDERRSALRRRRGSSPRPIHVGGVPAVRRRDCREWTARATRPDPPQTRRQPRARSRPCARAATLPPTRGVSSTSADSDRQDDQQLLRMLACRERDHDQAGAERARDRAGGVGRVHAANEAAGILAAARGRGASASGKLAPHRIAPGRTTGRHRHRSS